MRNLIQNCLGISPITWGLFNPNLDYKRFFEYVRCFSSYCNIFWAIKNITVICYSIIIIKCRSSSLSVSFTLSIIILDYCWSKWSTVAIKLKIGFFVTWCGSTFAFYNSIATTSWPAVMIITPFISNSTPIPVGISLNISEKGIR